MRQPFDQDDDDRMRPASGSSGPWKPPDRALDAMAQAAARARQSGTPGARPPTGGWRPSRPVLLSALAALAAAGLVLGLVFGTGGTPSGPTPSTRANAVPPPAGSSPTTTATTAAPSTTSPSTTSPTSTTTPSSTTTAPTGGSPGGPQLSSIVPDGGTAGQLISISGSGLYSPTGGDVLASFGGTVAPTYCSSQTSCLVEVPDLGPSAATVAVTVTTDAGTSNAVSFSYG